MICYRDAFTQLFVARDEAACGLLRLVDYLLSSIVNDKMVRLKESRIYELTMRPLTL